MTPHVPARPPAIFSPAALPYVIASVIAVNPQPVERETSVETIRPQWSGWLGGFCCNPDNYTRRNGRPLLKTQGIRPKRQRSVVQRRTNGSVRARGRR